MSAIGLSTLTLYVNRAQKMIQAVGRNFFRQSLSISIHDHEATSANLTLVMYRGADVMQMQETFTGSDPAVAALDTNVTTVDAIMDGVNTGESRTFGLRLWDSASGELLAEGDMALLGNAMLIGDDGLDVPATPTTTPGGWVNLGNDWWNGSDHYTVNATTGLLRKTWYEGSGDEFHAVYDDAANEIPIPTT